MGVKSFQDLEVWNLAMELAVHCYKVTKIFPSNELFGLTSQIRRAATSVPANIAEGQSRNSTKEFLNFLGIARGSLSELETHLILSHRVGLLADQALKDLTLQLNSVGRMVSALRNSLKKRL